MTANYLARLKVPNLQIPAVTLLIQNHLHSNHSEFSSP